MLNQPGRLTAEQIERLALAVARLRTRLGMTEEDAVARIEQFGLEADAALGDVALVRIALRQRARRNERLGVDLFRDPAWDMLLTLLVAHREGRGVTVSGLCFASGVPATTALRYVDRLAEEGLIRRSGDFTDQRRVLVTIVPDRVPAVEAVVRDVTALTIQAPAARGRGAVPD